MPKAKKNFVKTNENKIEIVALHLENDQITNNPAIIKAALQMGMGFKFIPREVMELMDACDMGPKWKEFATGKTLLTVKKWEETAKWFKL